jgi:hypothetical protein
MIYQKTSGGYPQHRTGSYSSALKLKPGINWWDEDPAIDAPECIVGGSSVRAEWRNHFGENVMSWFPAQHITLRG